MAATELDQTDAASPSGGGRAGWGPVVMAALALPCGGQAQTSTEPMGNGAVALRWLIYEDWQPGLRRIAVSSPAFQVRTPEVGPWSLEAQLATDSVSGASPRWHSSISGASRMQDKRRSADLAVSREQDQSRWTLRSAMSEENDFRSKALSVQRRLSSDDNNRTWTVGAGTTHDRIGSSDDPALDRGRRTTEVEVGITQAVSRTDLVQLTVMLSRGVGYYDDPYKRPDRRPDQRRQVIGMLRWNHHAESWGVTVRNSLRLYQDSFGIRGITAQVEPVWTPTPDVSFGPLLRYYTQRAAWFYFDPVYSFVGAPNPPGFPAADGPASADQRLAAFGALALGFRVVLRLPDGWSSDVRLERYEQRGSWRLGGPGSPGLLPFSAHFVQWGLTKKF